VEVDPETGVIEVVRYTSIDDCGRAVNPMLIHGQSHGGIAQGIGQALWEECFYEPNTAQLLSGSLMDYALPRADSLPFFHTEISEFSSTTNPLGMRGRERGRHNARAGSCCKCDCQRAISVWHPAHRAAGHTGANLERDPELV